MEVQQMGDGQLCNGGWERMTTENDCKIGVTLLDRWPNYMTFVKSWSGSGDFPGCVHRQDNKVFFNTSPTPSTTANNPTYAEICKSK
jgi:hypothetical protein